VIQRQGLLAFSNASVRAVPKQFDETQARIRAI
jgi:hypothetical protein